VSRRLALLALAALLGLLAGGRDRPRRLVEQRTRDRDRPCRALGTTTASATTWTCGGLLGTAKFADALASTTADFAAPVASGTTSSASSAVTARAILKTTVSLRVRATVGTWTGAWSPTLTTSAGPCL
jgi:hypothetical protein